MKFSFDIMRATHFLSFNTRSRLAKDVSHHDMDPKSISGCMFLIKFLLIMIVKYVNIFRRGDIFDEIAVYRYCL